MNLQLQSNALFTTKILSGLRVAVVVKHYAVHRSQPILLMLDFLQRQGCEVTLVLQNAGTPPERLRKTVKVIEIPTSGLGKIGAALALASRRFDLAIAYDPHAFHLAHTRMQAEALIYYSLEVFLKTLSEASYPDSLAAFERRHVNAISGLIIQSVERLRIFAAEYCLDETMPTFLQPVCARPDGVRSERRRLSPKGGRRIIHLGGLTSEQGVPRFCEAMNKIDGWELVLHGHGFGAALAELKNRIDGHYAGYYRHARLHQVYFETPEEAELLCGEMDVGLAWYDRGLSPNFDTAALSSGKIAAYLKKGLPLIVSRGQSFVDVLEGAGCAVALDTPEDLPSALAQIEQNYEEMSAAALRLFSSTYDVSNYEPGLLEFIRRIVTTGPARG